MSGFLLTALMIVAPVAANAAPPYSGTIFLDPDIITAADPTAFTGLTYTGRGNRLMYDRRVPGWITTNALVRIDSADASLVLTNAQDVSNANRVFNGTSFTTYASTPGFFVPSTWDGMSAETITIVEVPEPATAALAVALLGVAASRRKQ